MNRIQVSEQKNNSDKIQSRLIIPLTGNVIKENNSDKLKELRSPRSRKYIQNLIELQELLSELDKQRKEKAADNLNHTNDNNQRPDSYSSLEDVNEEPYKKGNQVNGNYQENMGASFEAEGKNREIEESTWRTEENANETKVNTWNTFKEENWYPDAEVSSQQTTTQELTRNSAIDELEKRIQEKLEQLGKENARISEMLTLLYQSDKEEYLMECGVISRPGTPVYSREDMAVGVGNPRDAQQLKRGYDLYFNYTDSPDFLTMEIYIDAYCVIYKDGIVKTIV